MLLALAALSVNSCISTIEIPLLDPIEPVAESEFDCVSEEAFDYMIRLRERVITYENMIRATH